MTNVLTDNLALITGAPGGVATLRGLILDLAVRGRLVEQDPRDEPASELVERILADRRGEVGAGRKGRAPRRQLGELESAKIDLPDGWEAGLFGEILSLEYGQSLPKGLRSNTGRYPVYGSNGIVGTHESCNVSAPCIVVGRKGSAGALNLSDSDGCWVTDVAYYCVPSSELSLDYVYLIFQTLRLDKLSKGIKPGLSRNEVLSLVLAIPPRAEQVRIVSKVRELMAFCDVLELKQMEASALHTQIVEVFLRRLGSAKGSDEFSARWRDLESRFDELFVTEESIDLLERSIHFLSVTGKLVPQDSDDLPASSLMQALREDRLGWLKANQGSNSECRRMLTKLATHGDTAELPFVLPESWVVVPLIDCCRILADCHNKTAPYVASGIPLIRTSNIRDGKFRMEGLKFVSEETYELWARRCPPAPGDIIFTREAPMGEAAIIPPEAQFCLGQRTMLVRPMHDYIVNDYLLLVLTEAGLLDRASSVGSTVQHLRVADVERLAVPIPPLPEQKRIVARVRELGDACRILKGRLRQVSESSEQIAETIAVDLSQVSATRDLQLTS